MATVFLSADACKTWDKSGKSDFIKACKSLGEESFYGQDTKTVQRALYELCWSVLKGQLKQDQCISTIGEINDQMKGIGSLLADTLATIDVECSCNDDKHQRDRLNSLLAACSSIITEPVMKERFDQETLEIVGIIQSKQLFQQKYVKTKTRLYYKQQKFNLLREESEGYSKLVSELNQEITEKVTPVQVLENIKSLIGCFDLDPNRVLDIMLEAFECNLESECFYIPLLRAYMTDKSTLCQVMGFRFHFYQPTQGIETPSSLYKVTALLLKHELLNLNDLYPHLLPEDGAISDFHKTELSEARSYAKKLNLVILSDKKEDEKDKEDLTKVDMRINNQKLGICEALLEIGAWDNAKSILDKLPEFFPGSHPPIARALCLLIHKVIEPLYRKNTTLPPQLCKKKVVIDKLCIEPVKTFRRLHHVAFPMLYYLGPHASLDPVLFMKLVRLGKTFMNMRSDGGVGPEDEVAYFGFLNILDSVIFPSLSLLPCNCCISEELWGFLKLYPYEIRYRLYGRWKNEIYSQQACLVRARADCLERAKYIMKRLAKENVKQSGRQLGKLCHSNPAIMFEFVLSQIQRYDNFIGPVVDCLKFLTSLSYDILSYCIIEAVANPEKERLKTDDTNISLWLQSLANFAGMICRKYTVDLSGMMQYVANQLKAGKSFDLLLLREIVTKMAGIEISEEVTNDQLEAMSGGELLRQEGGYFSQVRNTKKSSTRLKDTLLEHDLALSLCILMAQQRDSVIYHEDQNRHLKLVGKLYDQCQDTLCQFGTFLSMQLSTEEFVKRLPSIDVLVSEYHVPPDAAFFLTRPQYTHLISVRYEELRKIDKSNKTASQNKTQRYIEAAEEVMKPAVNTVRQIYEQKIWDDLSAKFYATFWSLSMYDLFTPKQAYEKQTAALNSQIAAIEDNRDMPHSKKKKEKERCQNLIEKLKEEEKRQNDHTSRVLARLKKSKDQWFLSRVTKNEAVTHFLQLCVFPRCIFTASDAVYCSKFIHVLHQLKTPNFSTLICYDRIFCDITYCVTSCTENEAHRYGRFLCTTLDTVMKWHSDKTSYEKECATYPGFVTVFRKGTDSSNKADQLDFENYRHVCHKWHFRITKSMVSSLESGNYIQIRNSLIVLTRILPHYPRILQFCQALERRVDRLGKEEKEKRPDLYALALGYAGQLKNKKSTWIPEHEFHIKDKEAPKSKISSNGVSKSDVKNGVKNSSKPSDVEGEKGKENKEVREKVDKSNDKKTKPDKPVEKREKKPKDERETKTSLDGLVESGAKSRDRSPKDKSDGNKESKSKEDKILKEEAKKKEMRREEKAKLKEEKRREKEERREERREERKRRSASRDREKIVEERSSSVQSNGSHGSHRRSASPRHVEERDVKRRKVDLDKSGSKDGVPDKIKYKRSPSTDREREKKERKRELSPDRDTEAKKRRSEEGHSRSKMNGEPDMIRKRSESSDRARDRFDYETAAKRTIARKTASFDAEESKSKKKEKEKDKVSKKVKK
ncbi:hypothetical protein SNE40_020916 [Patella caerulea]|uniref:THO complex subunit 2 n=1 Tax=Patella caerulea TaxID=87958 RepID=A0AAN8J4G4_PATCE